jgi:hypothetical protein
MKLPIQMCRHSAICCLNEYELIRKYRCLDCGAVMMCDCDERVARKCLPHQLDQGVELKTQKRVPVTLGFQPQICRDCRGLPVQAHPVAAIYGRTSKIRRYYWRELALQEMERFSDWESSRAADGTSDGDKAAMHKQIEAAVLAEVKALHASSPKYRFKERSQAEIVQKYEIETVDLKATYVRNCAGGPVAILDETEPCRVEEFVARHFRRIGFHTIFLESTPFHVLFGVYMWLLIQDPSDARVRVVSFGDRHAFDEHVAAKQIWASLPEDFGTAGYAARRARAIKRHLAEIADDRTELQWLFGYWLPHSESLRQYLWAHRLESVRAAKALVDILQPAVIKAVLLYLVRNYWRRYLGWPDLLAYRGDEWFFAEVKSSGDKLSDEQKRWIEDNHRHLKLPFKLVKVHRVATAEMDVL